MTDLLAQLEDLIVTELPSRLCTYACSEALACAHIIYYDTHAPCGYVDVSVTTVSRRAELYSEDPADYWDGWGSPGNYQLAQFDGPIFDRIYTFISADGKADENMGKYRNALAIAALRINQSLRKLDIPNLTDDFVVVLGDGSRWASGPTADVLDCITKNQRQLLIDRGFWTEDDRY